MRERSRLPGGRCAFIVVALVFVTAAGTLVRPARAAAGTSFTVHGTLEWEVKEPWSITCVPNPDGTSTCTISASEDFHGGIRGEVAWNQVAVRTPGHPFPTGLGTGTLLCSPCTLAGLTGTITFSFSFVTDVQFRATLTDVQGTGQFEGLTGTGSIAGTFASLANPYVFELTLPA